MTTATVGALRVVLGLDSAAFTEICWPTMERASVLNGSPRRASAMRGWARMIAASTASRRTSARLARCQ